MGRAGTGSAPVLIVNTMPHKPSARRVAAERVARWAATGLFPDRLLDGVRADRAWVAEVVYGVVRWCRALDWILARLAPRRPAPELRAVLLVGLYQLFYLDAADDHATVHETVEAAKAAGGAAAAGFVNAVLRRAQREREGLRAELARQPEGVRASHPDALLERWRARWGGAGTTELCAWDNLRPDLVVRLRSGGLTPVEFAARCAAAGHRATPHPAAPGECFVLSPGTAPAELPGYAEGGFAVQDPATLAAPRLLRPEPGQAVLDACAAPGGKTALLAEALGGRGVVVALELHADRLARLRENVARLRLDGVRVTRGDAGDSRLAERLRAAGAPCVFDRILLDVPCSNTGVLRRRVDARWRFSAARLRRLVSAQRRILDGCAGLLQPGGLLVYSTCSLEPEENEEQVGAWLRVRPDFRRLAEQTFFPPRAGTDGGYVALLARNPANSVVVGDAGV